MLDLSFLRPQPNSVAKPMIAGAVAMGLAACGGGGGGGGGGGTTSSVTISGQVYDGPIGNAVVTVHVGDDSYQATTDAQGNYTVEVEGADSDFVWIEGEKGGEDVTLRSAVGELGEVANAAGGDNTADKGEVPEALVSNLSTAVYAVLEDFNGGNPVSSADELETASAGLGEHWDAVREVAIGIKAVVDQGTSLPGDASNTLDMARNATDPDRSGGTSQEFDTWKSTNSGAYETAEDNYEADSTFDGQETQFALSGTTFVYTDRWHDDADGTTPGTDVVIFTLNGDGTYTERYNDNYQNGVQQDPATRQGDWSVTSGGKYQLSGDDTSDFTLVESQGNTLTVVLHEDSDLVGTVRKAEPFKASQVEGKTFTWYGADDGADGYTGTQISFDANGTGDEGGDSFTWEVTDRGRLEVTWDSDGATDTFYRLAGSDAEQILIASYAPDHMDAAVMQRTAPSVDLTSKPFIGNSNGWNLTKPSNANLTIIGDHDSEGACEDWEYADGNEDGTLDWADESPCFSTVPKVVATTDNGWILDFESGSEDRYLFIRSATTFDPNNFQGETFEDVNGAFGFDRIQFDATGNGGTLYADGQSHNISWSLEDSDRRLVVKSVDFSNHALYKVAGSTDNVLKLMGAIYNSGSPVLDEDPLVHVLKKQ